MPAYCYGFNVYKQANVNMSLDLESTIEGCKEWSRFSTATLTYIHARIQEIFERFGGGGMGYKPDWLKKALTLFFSFLFCKSSASPVIMAFSKKTIIKL